MHPDALTRSEVISAIERRGCRRVPLMIRMWIGGDCYDAYGDRLRNFVQTIPEDVLQVGFRAPGGWEGPEDDPEYRWAIREKPEDEESKAVDSRRFLSDWKDLDEFIEKMPSPDKSEFFANAARAREENPDAFVGGMGFFCFYERLWTIRGMNDLLADFLLEPERVMRLIHAIRDYHLKVIRGYGEAGADAFYTSDDMGTQTSLFFSPDVFRKFLKPDYATLISEAHSHGMKFWLHACGNMTSIIEDLIEIGLDVLHPIQPYAMDPQATAEAFGERITFMPGIDVQHLLPHCTSEEVKAGTRTLIDTFLRPGGGMIVSMSNAIHTDVSYENIKAFMQTAYEYGRSSVQQSAISGRPGTES
jgi:uroporphyrinogen decarboxylase